MRRKYGKDRLDRRTEGAKFMYEKEGLKRRKDGNDKKQQNL